MYMCVYIICVCVCVCVCVYHMIAFNGGENTDPLGTLGLNKHDGEFLEFLFCFMYSRLGPKVGNLEIPIGTDKKKKKKKCPNRKLALFSPRTRQAKTIYQDRQ